MGEERRNFPFFSFRVRYDTAVTSDKTAAFCFSDSQAKDRAVSSIDERDGRDSS